MNGFDRVADGEDILPHGLPPIPEEFTASLRSDLQELKNAISMPAETRPRQKTMDLRNKYNSSPPWEDQCEWHIMPRTIGRDCAFMCNLINTHTLTHTPLGRINASSIE